MISCSLKQQVWLRGGENIQSPTATRPEMQLIQLCWYSTKYWPLKDKTWDNNFIHYSGGIDPVNDIRFQSACKQLVNEIDTPRTRLPSLKMKYNEGDPKGIHDIVLRYCTMEVDHSFSTLFAL